MQTARQFLHFGFGIDRDLASGVGAGGDNQVLEDLHLLQLEAMVTLMREMETHTLVHEAHLVTATAGTVATMIDDTSMKLQQHATGVLGSQYAFR